MSHTVLYVEKSANAKTGPIPVSYFSSTTCPDTCPLQRNGCYGDDFHTRLQWGRVDRGEGISWSEYCAKVAARKADVLHRAAVVGDLPRTDDGLVDRSKMLLMAEANAGKPNIWFSHNRGSQAMAVIREANSRGLVINLSANTLDEVDALLALGVGPVVTLLPKDAPTAQRTSNGHKVVVCPAQLADSVTCNSCRLCAKGTRRTVVGFRAHGTRSAKADHVARTISITPVR